MAYSRNPKRSEAKAGTYQLQAAAFRSHRTGDLVELNDEEARRLVKPGVFCRPGEAGSSRATKRAYRRAEHAVEEAHDAVDEAVAESAKD